MSSTAKAILGRAAVTRWSDAQAPLLGRPPGVASRWLRQPRPGTHSQGFRAYEEDGDKQATAWGEHPVPMEQSPHVL